MKYVSIDIECLGLNPKTHSTIQFGAVIEDTVNIVPLEDLPRFECLVEHQEYHGTPYAMGMHHNLFVELADKESKKLKVKHYEVAEAFAQFLVDNGIGTSVDEPIEIRVAGKNFATFDKLFLEELPHWKSHIRIKQRILDPAILFWDSSSDEDLPNLEECKRRAGMVVTTVAHTAVEDALDVIQILRIKYK